MREVQLYGGSQDGKIMMVRHDTREILVPELVDPSVFLDPQVITSPDDPIIVPTLKTSSYRPKLWAEKYEDNSVIYFERWMPQ